MGKRKDQETKKGMFGGYCLKQVAESKGGSDQYDCYQDFFGKESRHDQGEQGDQQVCRPIGNWFGVDHEKLMKQAVVVKYKLVDDV